MMHTGSRVRTCVAATLAFALAFAPTLGQAGPPAPARPLRPGSTPGASPATDSGAPPTTRSMELTGDERGLMPHNTCKKQPRGARFTITLPRETELEDLVNWMMSVSCQKFVWDRKVRSGKVTILSPETVNLEEAYAAFYAALETMGLTVEPSGDYFKIVESTDAKSRTVPVYGPEGRAPTNDRYVTQLVRVKGGNTKDIVDLLGKLRTKQGSIDAVGNLVIITDTGSNVRRLMRIVNELDAPATGERIFFYQLKYADAEEVAALIRDIFGEGKGAAAGKGKRGGEPSFSRVIVDARTGTLVIVAFESDYAVIRRLIEQLDVLLPGGGGRLHVHKLKNADATEVAQVLSQLAAGAKQQRDAGKGGTAKPPGPVPEAAEAAELFSGDIKVTPDPATRSLVIVASQTDYNALKRVIDELDRERKQVFMEVYLLEVNVKKSIEGGAGAHFGAPFPVDVPGGGQGQALGVVGSTPSPQLQSVNPAGMIALTGLVGGVIGPLIPGSQQFFPGLGRDVPAFGVVIQALESNNDVNVVSNPHAITADNKEALIEVGRNVPTPGALSFTGGAGGAGGVGLVPLQSVDRQDVTLRVKLKPHINDERTVTLEIDMEQRDIESQDQRLGVTTSKRKLKLDNVIAYDDQPVVLGGLVHERESETVQQIPGLGSIPVLGWLFKRKVRAREKMNLLMIIVPHIIETPDDIRRVFDRRTRERMEFLEQQTAFKRKDLPSNVNYRKKAGLLASVDREARRMEDEERTLRQAELELQRESITGEIGMSPRTSNANAEDDAAEAKPGAPPRPAMPMQPAPPPPPPPAPPPIP